MPKAGYYVCQRAAQAIIAEIGPLRVSTDALQAINVFLDEFIALLATTAESLDLLRLKAAVVQLLPYSLGKNALVEAELELNKRIVDTEDDDEQNQIDLSTYENMRSLNAESVNQIIPVLQAACADFCELNAKNHNAQDNSDNSSNSNSDNNNNNNEQVIIAPVIVIYVTTIVEHIAEYLLDSIAKTADETHAEHIRVKEVLLCLLDDPQAGDLFNRMNLKEKLQKRASTYIAYLPSPLLSPISLNRDHRHSNSPTQAPTAAEHHFTIDYQSEENDLDPRVTPSPSSACSIRSSSSINDRPLSIVSNGTVKSSGSKSRFNFFSNISNTINKKEKRSSISLNFSSKRSTSNPPSIASPTTPSYTTANMDFETLMRSGSTKKVSLTPNRLRSIEVKDNDTLPCPNKVNNNNNNTKSHTRTKKRSSSSSFSSSCPPPPIPPLPKLNRDQHALMAGTGGGSVSGGDSGSGSGSVGFAAVTTTNNNINIINNIINNNSPPLTPASSVASRPSQRSRHSIIYEEKSARTSMRISNQDDVLVEETTTNLMGKPSKMSTSSSGPNSRRSTLSAIERPSSMVVKRASTGSRPPSFHEHAIEIMGNTLIAAAHGISLEDKVSQVDQQEQQQQQQQHNMIYVLPSAAARSPISSRLTSAKARTMDRGCQTEPVDIRPLHTTADGEQEEQEDQQEQDEQQDDEEWFLDESEEDEEDWNNAQEEKVMAEWLLGNV